MTEPDYDELEKIKYHVLRRIPFDENRTFLVGTVVIGLLACGFLAGVAYTAKLFSYDPQLAVAIVGIGFVAGSAFACAALIIIRVEAVQRHLITLHEDLLSMHSDIRER